MNIFMLFIMAIASLTSIACALPGTFLILRKVGMMSDAISHAILPGIVIMFLLVQKLESPILLLGASCAGIITVLTIEMIIQKKRLQKDAAIGFVFPFFFSIGIILICKYARTVHLDTDMVIIGELAFTPFKQLLYNGISLGPHALWNIGFVTLLNITLTILFYKELQLSTFDPTFARITNAAPHALYYGLMTIASITAVSSFNIVGSIVVITLTLAPPATALLLTNRLPALLIISCLIGAGTALGGYGLAHMLDVSIAGSIAAINGFIFLIVCICAPETGIIRNLLFNRHKRTENDVALLCAFLEKNQTTSIPIITGELCWSDAYTKKIITSAHQDAYVNQQDGNVLLTAAGQASVDTYRQNLINLKKN